MPKPTPPQRCSVCSQRLLESVEAICGHRFCLHCLEFLFRTSKGEVSCPDCSTSISLYVLTISDVVNKRCSTLDPFLFLSSRADSKACKEARVDLYVAAVFGDMDQIRTLCNTEYIILMKSGENMYGWCPLHVASRNGHVDVIRYLVSRGFCLEWISDTKYGVLPIHCAAIGGQIEMVDYFISSLRMNVDTRDDNFNRTPLMWASLRGELDMVKWLVKNGADVRAESNTKSLRNIAIHLASELGHVGVVKYMIEEVDQTLKYATNTFGQVAMHLAAQSGEIEVVRYFLDHTDVNIETKCRSGNMTSLHYACANGRLGLVKFLLQRDADIRARDCLGDTGLHVASFYGKLEIVKYLMSVDSNLVNVKSRKGVTAIERARKSHEPGAKSVVQYLFKNLFIKN